MTEQELKELNEVQEKIDDLKDEIYLLFNALKVRMNPIRRLFSLYGTTSRLDYRHEATIVITAEDIRAMQRIRLDRLEELRKIIEKDPGETI